MEDAEQLPKEESIAKLIKKKVEEEINKVKAQLTGKGKGKETEASTSRPFTKKAKTTGKNNNGGRPRKNNNGGRPQENNRQQGYGQRQQGYGQRQQGNGQRYGQRQQGNGPRHPNGQPKNFQNQGNGPRQKWWTPQWKQPTHTNVSATFSKGNLSAPKYGSEKQQRPQNSFTAPKQKPRW